MHSRTSRVVLMHYKLYDVWNMAMMEWEAPHQMSHLYLYLCQYLCLNQNPMQGPPPSTLPVPCRLPSFLIFARMWRYIYMQVAKKATEEVAAVSSGAAVDSTQVRAACVSSCRKQSRWRTQATQRWHAAIILQRRERTPTPKHTKCHTYMHTWIDAYRWEHTCMQTYKPIFK